MTERFDYLHPDYAPVYAQRAARLRKIRERPEMLPGLKLYYRDHIADFINDWGITSDPRNVEIGQPVSVPFLLFPRQREWIDWLVERWKAREDGATPKSREMGLSWLAMSAACSLCLFYDELAIGFGSRKLELVDKLGDPKCLFWKGRKFLEMLPDEFTGGWRSRTDSVEKLLRFPTTGSSIAGEGGDDIGRGARAGMYFTDEDAFLEHPDEADAALSQTTNCRIRISTPNGLANPFARVVVGDRQLPERQLFWFHWRDDPRKDDAWYEKQKQRLDPIVLAQEVDMDFAASVEGLLIPALWVQAAIDAHVKLGIVPTGAHDGALDVADEGRDKNAFAACHGVVVTFLEEWSGKGSDIFSTVQRAFALCDGLGLYGFRFDSDGLGAGVRGDARVINEQRRQAGMIAGAVPRTVTVLPFRGSGGVIDPERQDEPSRLNQDFFKNLKAQAWWGLRRRFRETWRAINGETYNPDLLISLSRETIPPEALRKLVAELSQPTYSIDTTGKIVVDKQPDGTRSPNLADAVMILMGRPKRPMVINPALVGSRAA